MGRKQKLREQRKLEEVLEQTNINKNKQKINRFLTTLATITAALTIGYVSLNYFTSDLNLENARRNPEARQKYLDNLVSTNDIPYTSGIIYDETGEKMPKYIASILKNHNVPENEIEEAIIEPKKLVANGNFDAKTPEVFDFSGEGIKPAIYIGKKLFEEKYSESEIKNCIIYHEGRHAEQFSRGLEALGYIDKQTIKDGLESGKIPYALLYGIGEIDAMNCELKSVEEGKMKVNSDYYNKTLKTYNAARTILSNASTKTRGDLKTLIDKTLEQNPAR
jgi:hypothetical protein